MVAHQPPQSVPLTSHHDPQRHGQIGFRVELRSVNILQPDNPDMLIFELSNSAGKVGHLSHQEMLHRPGGDVDCGRCDSGRAPFLDDDAMDTHCFGGTHQGTQVMNVLHQI